MMGIGSNILKEVKNNATDAVKGAVDEFKDNLVDEVLNEFGIDTHNNLKRFFDKVSDAHNEGIAIRQPDPLNSFDVRFKFYPTINVSPNKNTGLAGKAINALTNAAKNTVRSTLNKATYGLVGSLMNDIDIIKEHDKFQTIRSSSESHTFMEYLAKANLLCGSESNWIGGMGTVTAPLEIDMTYFIQKMTVPHLKFNTEQDEVAYFGNFPINGRFVEPDNHNLTMNILNTRVPILERIFYPWMREVTLPYWSYSTQPYTTATITVDLGSHTDISYVFIGCRPCDIECYNPDQGLPGAMDRQVSFVFDYMFINSGLSTTDDIVSKAMSVASTLIRL